MWFRLFEFALEKAPRERTSVRASSLIMLSSLDSSEDSLLKLRLFSDCDCCEFEYHESDYESVSIELVSLS